MKYLNYLYIVCWLCLLSFPLSAQHAQPVQAPHHWCGTKVEHHLGGLRALRSTQFKDKSILNDNKLRIYRLALPVDYDAYRDLFNSSKDEVRQWWRESVDFLNQVYVRDVGIKFELVDDDKLIITEASQIKFDNMSPDSIIPKGTATLNALDPPTYDLGVWVTKTTDDLTNGIAYISIMHGRGSFQRNVAAGALVSVKNPATLAHEIGHMFGAHHTFYYGGDVPNGSLGTEAFVGNSIMSYYAGERTYFAIANIYEIREHINEEGYNNRQTGHSFPRVIESTNQAPVLDKSRIKSSYTVPVGSYFSAPMQAIDADGNTLSYAQHFASQAKYKFATEQEAKDKQFMPWEHPNFLSAAFRVGRPHPFQRPLNLQNNTYAQTFYREDYNTRFFKGDYILWMAVRDVSDDENFKVLYDTHQTQIKIVDGTAFDILPSSGFKASYDGGETIDLKWSVDTKIFAGTKVRILLSDNYGESFDYVLLDETPNDGAETITLPTNVDIPLSKNPQWLRKGVGLGVIRIEVIDHIVFADSHIGGKDRPNDDQRYSFRLRSTVDPVTPQITPEDSETIAPLSPKTTVSTPIFQPNRSKASVTVHRQGSGAVEIVALAHDVMKVIAKPNIGQRVESIRLRYLKQNTEQDITTTRSFVLTDDVVVTVVFAGSSQKPNIKVYPTRANDYINIDAKQAHTSIYITPMLGTAKMLLGRTDADGMARCHIGGYPRGSYIVSVGQHSQTIFIE